MTNAGVAFAVIMSFLMIGSLVINHYHMTLINRYEAKLKEHNDALDIVYKNNKEMIRYCLQRILKEAIDTEDYLVALNCKNLIEILESSKKD